MTFAEEATENDSVDGLQYIGSLEFKGTCNE